MSNVIQIKDDMKQAMRAKDTSTLTMLRIILGELENKKVEHKLKVVEELSTEQVEEVLVSQLKKLNQELEGLKSAGRATDKVKFQQDIVKQYLPEQLDEEQLVERIKQKMVELDVTSPAGQGKLMGALSKDLKGKADLGLVSKLVREMLK